MSQNESNRILEAYDKRRTERKLDLYKWHKADAMLRDFSFKRAMVAMLLQHGYVNLESLNAVDIGCNSGGWLRTLVSWGMDPKNLHGIDILDYRIEEAKKLSPGITFEVTSGWPIPIETETKDLVVANLVFSSILDPAARADLAKEMYRIVKPGGLILIYDFRISSPNNPDTCGIGKSEIRRLFPDCTLKYKVAGLAPPLARKLASLSWYLSLSVEYFFPILNSHLVFGLQKAHQQ